MTTTTKTVDSAFWTTRPAFGVAGGPKEHALTDAGVLRARMVAMQLDESGVAVLVALSSGEKSIEEANGSRLCITDFGRMAQPFVTHELIERGLVESVFGRCRSLRLTDAGRHLVSLAESEVHSLLARVKANHPI